MKTTFRLILSIRNPTHQKIDSIFHLFKVKNLFRQNNPKN